MRKYILSLIFLAIFITGCDGQPDTRSIDLNIQASGEIEVKPDIAEFWVKISCVNKDLNISNTCLKNRVNIVFETLNKFQIDKKDFHSSQVSLDKDYFWKNKTQTFRGYRSSMSISIFIRDLKKLNVLLGTLMKHKNLTISGLSYSHSKIETLKIDSYLKALDNAQMLAKSMQNKIGGKSIEIVEINNTGEPKSPVRKAKFLRQSNEAEHSSFNINIGTLVLRKRLIVQFRILKWKSYGSI